MRCGAQDLHMRSSRPGVLASFRRAMVTYATVRQGAHPSHVYLEITNSFPGGLMIAFSTFIRFKAGPPARLLPALLCAVSLLAVPIARSSAQSLKVSAIPDESPTELLRKFKPLGQYLEEKLGMKVAWTPVNDYPAVVEGLAGRKIDLAWLGGFTFVQVRLRTGNAIPIAQRVEDEKFISYFIVPASSSAKSLQDLKGKTFAFGSPSSTSGHLMPRYFLS